MSVKTKAEEGKKGMIFYDLLTKRENDRDKQLNPIFPNFELIAFLFHFDFVAYFFPFYNFGLFLYPINLLESNPNHEIKHTYKR